MGGSGCGGREATVSLGVSELEAGAEPLGRVRRPGGGRKRAAEVDPGLVPALLALVEPQERGDPESPLRWTAKSTRALAAELTAQGRAGRMPGCARAEPARASARLDGEGVPGLPPAVPKFSGNHGATNDVIELLERWHQHVVDLVVFPRVFTIMSQATGHS